jgi:hypothetical protein
MTILIAPISAHHCEPLTGRTRLCLIEAYRIVAEVTWLIELRREASRDAMQQRDFEANGCAF